jgi:beta-lactamase class A
MTRRRGLIFVRWFAFGFILAAILLMVMQLVRFSRVRNSYPAGMTIAGITVGGLNQQQAADRLRQAYGIPIELRYGNAVIQVKPAEMGFELDLEAMLAAAELQRISQPFWDAFWNYLWNSSPTAGTLPLSATISEERMRSYLQNEIAARYDQPPEEAIPVAGTTGFKEGKPGVQLDVDQTVQLVEKALRSPSDRVVNVVVKQLNPSRPSYRNLKILLEQIVQSNGFGGIIEVYLLDEQTGQEISFALNAGEEIPTGVAFTAASTIKIPVMISVFKRVDEPAPPEITSGLELMIEKSINEETDRLMRTVLDENLGPLEVTSDIQALGLENTFLAGYFSAGAPLLKRFDTPANTRTDVTTDPDTYNQTTVIEMGMILDDIYQCAKSGGGTFGAVFPGQVTQNECQLMINYLSKNEIGLLIEAGVPGDTRVAHKHGWLTTYSDGLIHTIMDAGIVFTPSGDYVLVIATYDAVQLNFEETNLVFAHLSQAVYNYINFK